MAKMAKNEEKIPAEIASLWDAYQQDNSMEARDALVEHYLPIVSVIAGRLAIGLPSHVDRDDLVSSGFFGLLDAVERYDYRRGNKFETYAGVRIRGAMLDYLRAKDWIPVSMRQKIRKYEQVVSKLEGKLGRSATDEELAGAMGISVAELHALEKQLNVATIIPLEEYIKTESPRSAEIDPQENVERMELKEILAKAISKLPEKESKVIALYYYEELTLKEISLVLHLTEARISQLHTKAVFRLRGYLSRAKSSLLQ